MKPPYGWYDPPETGCPCPICGYEVDRRRESWDYDADWQVCHETCLKEQEEEAWDRVTFYKSGEVTVKVHFPNGEMVCRWCPYVRYDESLHRHRCLFTGEYLLFPMETMGNQCPVKFESEV